MSQVVDFDGERWSKNIEILDAAACAQAALNTDVQLELSARVRSTFASPREGSRGDTDRILLVDALDLEVDAMCNEGRAIEANKLAQATIDQAEGLRSEGNWFRFAKSPRTLVAIQAHRILAQTIDMSGDPAEATQRLLGLAFVLERHPELGDVEPVKRELLKIYRAIFCAARREGSAQARTRAALVRRMGDPIAESVSQTDPTTAASYWHRAACEARSHGGASHGEAAELFRRSIPMRRASLRDSATIGFARGDLLVLDGYRDEGIGVITETLNDLRDKLPRHYVSARDLMLDRGLLAA